jgi:hypothetical protein
MNTATNTDIDTNTVLTVSIGDGVYDPQHGQVLGLFFDPEEGEVYSHPAAPGDGSSPAIFYGRHPQIAALRCACDLDEVAEVIEKFAPAIIALAECDPEDLSVQAFALRERIESRIAYLEPLWDAADFFEYEVRECRYLALWWAKTCETHDIDPDADNAVERLESILREPRVLRLKRFLENAQEQYFQEVSE